MSPFSDYTVDGNKLNGFVNDKSADYARAEYKKSNGFLPCPFPVPPLIYSNPSFVI
jgi:hypothetical protein